MGTRQGRSGCTEATALLVSVARLEHPRRVLIAMLAVLAALLVCSAPANALSQRGHAFAGAFGEAFGQGGADKLSGPSAVAVE